MIRAKVSVLYVASSYGWMNYGGALRNIGNIPKLLLENVLRGIV
jgi:hypothetical protein